MCSFLPPVLAPLDDSLTLLTESLEQLKAAQAVDIQAVIQQLQKAADSARLVREWVSSELPGVSWQSREELDTLFQQIQRARQERALAQQRSRLLGLATELERGSLVHRRSHRREELNQLREQAISELRSLAARKEGVATLPGPDAGQWLEWAWRLEEPRDADFIEALRSGFPQLDLFAGNLEPGMWIPAPAISQTLSEPEAPGATSQPSGTAVGNDGSSKRKASTLDLAPVEMRAAASASAEAPRFPGFLEELPLPSLESNTLTPNDATPPRTAEEFQRMQEQERALYASVIGLARDPAHHFKASGEETLTGEVASETKGTVERRRNTA